MVRPANRSHSNMIQTPLELYQDKVHPEWIDYNGHLNDGYYAVSFGIATERVLEYVEMDNVYREQTQCTWYTAEAHINYLRELKEGSLIHCHSQMLSADAKRMHLFHQMYHSEEGYLAATFELMLLHVDQSIGKVVPMPDQYCQHLIQIFEAHKKLPSPEQAGRNIRPVGKMS